MYIANGRVRDDKAIGNFTYIRVQECSDRLCNDVSRHFFNKNGKF